MIAVAANGLANLRIRKRLRYRLTNAFSRKIENHAAMVAIYFLWYNFGRVHQTLRVTRAMEAGIADHVWAIEEIVALIEELCVRPARRRGHGRRMD